MTVTQHAAVFSTAEDAVHALNTKRISARELMALTFKHVDRCNPELNALSWQNREHAFARAQELDYATHRGTPVGPLHGLPVTIKDAFAYRGTPNAWGVPALAHGISGRTATTVERLEAAGAIVIGKTNVSSMLGDWQTYNPMHGTTNNPWDLTRTPGGSTGGGAAAVAAGMGALALGTDLAGSIRIPAHFCGVYGHKPSLGLVSLDGLQPGPWNGEPGLPVDLAVAGLLSRSARDLQLGLRVIGGADRELAHAWSWQLPAPRHTRLADFRVGYVIGDQFAPVGSDIRVVYDAALSALRRCGVSMKEGWPPGVDPTAHLTLFQYLLLAFVTMNASEEARERARERFRKEPDDPHAAALAAPHAHWLQASQQRLMFRAAWQQYFGSFDVFLLPSSCVAAFPHDHREPLDARVIETVDGPRRYLSEIAAWSSLASVAGLPATVAPIGQTAAGLPVGLQIVAPMWEDATAIAFAAALGDVLGAYAPPARYAH